MERGINEFVLAVIPARYASIRFPGKPLAQIRGKSMIQWVYEGVGHADSVDKLIVAADDQRIIDGVEQFGGCAMMTSQDHPTGTDRVAEIAEQFPQATIILNIQGDEPMVNAHLVEALVKPLLENGCVMSTLRSPIHSQKDFRNPNIVKVLVDNDDFALYFSRSPIPYPCDVEHCNAFRHYGLYGFRRDFLLQFQQLARAGLELTEGLEQLRALQNGFRIKCPLVECETIEVNYPEDIQRLEFYLQDIIPVPDLKATNPPSRISDGRNYRRISSRLIQIWYKVNNFHREAIRCSFSREFRA